MRDEPELFHRMEYIPPVYSERIMVVVGGDEVPAHPPNCAFICIGLGYGRYMSHVSNHTGASQVAKLISEPDRAQCLLVAMSPDEFFTHPANSHVKINNLLKFLRMTTIPVEYWGKRTDPNETYALTCNSFYDAHHLMMTVCHYGRRPVAYDTFNNVNEIQFARYTYNPASGNSLPKNQITHTLVEILRDGLRHSDEISKCLKCEQSNSGYNMYRPFVSLLLSYYSASPLENTYIAYEMYRCSVMRKTIYARLKNVIDSLKRSINFEDIIVFREKTALDARNGTKSTEKEYLYSKVGGEYYIDGYGKVDTASTDSLVREFKLQLNIV